MGQVTRLIMVHHLLPWFHLSLRRFDRSIIRTYTTISGWYAIVQISDAVIGLADVLVVGAVAGVRPAALYAVAQRLGNLPYSAVSPRIFVVFSQAGQLAARDGLPALRGMTDDVLRFVQCLTIPAAIALGFLAGPALEVWVGPLYRSAAPIVGLLCLACIVQAWSLAIRQAINGAGRPALSAVLYSAEAALHVGLGIVLASRYGALGMAEAVLITVVLIEGALMLPLGYRMIGDSVLRPLLATVRTSASQWSSRAVWPGSSGGVVARSTPSSTRTAVSSGSSWSPRPASRSWSSSMRSCWSRCRAAQRQQFVSRFRTSLGRIAALLH